MKKPVLSLQLSVFSKSCLVTQIKNVDFRVIRGCPLLQESRR